MRLSFVLSAGLILSSLTRIACAQSGCTTRTGPMGETITMCAVYTGRPNYAPPPREPRLSRAELALRKAFNSGVRAYDAKDWANAVKYFQEAVAHRPGQSNLRQWLGHSQNQLAADAYGKGDWATAVEFFQKAVSVTPDDPQKKTMLENLSLAQVTLQRVQADQLHEAELRRESAVAATAMKAKLGQMVDSLSSATMRDAVNDKTASKGLTFQGAETPSQDGTSSSQQGLIFMGSGSTDFFGVKSNASPTDLHRDDTNIPGAGTAAMDQLKSMAGSSIAGQQQTNIEASAVEAGRTPDQGLGRPEQAPVITASTPPSQRILPPAVAKAVAADKDYQALEAQRVSAQQEKAQAEQELRALEEKQKTESDSQQRQANQIAISNLTQRKQAAEGRAATAQLQQEQIIQRYEGAPIIVPPASQNTTSPKNPDPPRTP